ncbi:MAG: hypothetical protein ABI633_04990 [Burkholderiales bacterium]
MRMHWREDVARVPDFSDQRTRQASVAVEVVDSTPRRIVHDNLSVLAFGADGLLEVERLNSQQIARVGDPFAPTQPGPRTRSPVVDAAAWFIARGGSWELELKLLRRIEAQPWGICSARASASFAELLSNPSRGSPRPG